MDMMFMEENPTKRRRKKTTKRRKVSRRGAATLGKRRRRSNRGTASTVGKRRRRKSTVSVLGRKRRRKTTTTKRRRSRRGGSPILAPQQTTQGRTRRRRRTTAKLMGRSYRKRRSSRGGLGFGGFSFNGILDDFLSIASLAGGIISGGAIQYIIAPFIAKKDADVTVQDAMIAAGATYGIGYGLEYFLKPNKGWMENLITGIKISGILNLSAHAFLLLFNDSYKLTNSTGLNQKDPFDMNKVVGSSKTLGEGFLVQDGDIYPLGASRRFISGADAYDQNYYNQEIQQLDSNINKLMNGAIVDTYNAMPPKSLQQRSRL